MFSRRTFILVIALIFIFLSIHFSHAQSWTQLTTSGGPPADRVSPTAIYDNINNRMTIFGGHNTHGSVTLFMNDTWILTNANGLGGTPLWIQLSPTGDIPIGRDGHTAVYDSTNNRMIIFGGTPTGYNSYFNDVWVLSNANGLGGTPTWTQLTTAGSTPQARTYQTAVYDSTNNRMIIFGGFYHDTYYHTLNDVWVLSNSNGLGGTPTWTQLITTGGSAMHPRLGHTSIYDNINNSMTIFGGQYVAIPGNDIYLNDVWDLSNANGLGGTPSWTQLFPTGSVPTTRAWHTAIYNPSNNRMTIFGGFYNLIGGLNDIWVLNYANGLGGTSSWQQLFPIGNSPFHRYGQSEIYDVTNNRLTIFGGYDGNYGYYFNDTWVLTNADYLTAVPNEIWKLLDK